MKISLKLLVVMAAIIYFVCLFIPETVSLKSKKENKTEKAELFVPGLAEKNSSPVNSSLDKSLIYNILDEKNGEILKVNERDFLISTVSLELSPMTNIEALKAQAVAARSFYRFKKLVFLICSVDKCFCFSFFN